MIYMDPHQLGWQPLVKSWMEQKLPDKMTAEQKETIRVRHRLILMLGDSYFRQKLLSHELMPGTDITPCIKTDKPLVNPFKLKQLLN